MGRRKKYENTRERIVETANRLFGQYGYEKTTMDDLIRDLEIGKATLYKEFSSKEDVLVAVLIRFMESLVSEDRQLLEITKAHFIDAIRWLLMRRVIAYYDYAKQHFHTIGILMEARQRFKDQQPLRPYFEEEINLLATLLEKAAKAHEIETYPDYHKLAIRIRKGLIGYHPPFTLMMSKEELETEAGWMVDVLLRGLSASKS